MTPSVRARTSGEARRRGWHFRKMPEAAISTLGPMDRYGEIGIGIRYKVHSLLTDNAIQFTDPPKNRLLPTAQ